MYCKNCGNFIDYDSKFCRYCGTNQNVSAPGGKKNKILEFLKRKKPQKRINTPKYDDTYKKETDATLAGILLFSINFILISVDVNIHESESLMVLVALGGLTLRIIITSWVVRIAKRQNRDVSSWGFFAFMLPSIALIIIGESRKISNNKSSSNNSSGNGPIPDDPEGESELNETKRSLKEDELILWHKDDERYEKIKKEDWEKARAKGADETFEVITS